MHTVNSARTSRIAGGARIAVFSGVELTRALGDNFDRGINTSNVLEFRYQISFQGGHCSVASVGENGM